MASDNFNRADAGSLGANWTEITNGFKIASNQADVVNSGPKQAAFYTGAASTNDQFSQSTAQGSPFQWGVGVRLANAGGLDGYVAMAGGGAGNINIYRFDNGTPTNMTLGSDSLAAGDVVKITVSGTTITAYKNGVQSVQATDATYASGQPGIYGEFSGFDIHDDWSGGDGDGTGGAAGTPFFTRIGAKRLA